MKYNDKEIVKLLKVDDFKKLEVYQKTLLVRKELIVWNYKQKKFFITVKGYEFLKVVNYD